MKGNWCIRSWSVALMFCILLWCSAALVEAADMDSREYKILLKTDYFVNREQGYQKYWDDVKKVAHEFGVHIIENSNPWAEDSKQVVYLDTKGLDLMKQNYILRIRNKVTNGKLAPDSELTLKYRVDKQDRVTEAAVQTSTSYKPSVKFQEDVVGFYQGKIGNNVSEFSLSHSIKKVPAAQRVVLDDYVPFFPILQTLGIHSTESLYILQDVTVLEYKVAPGELDFGNGLKGDVSISVWYDRSNSKLIIGEFSYEVALNSTASEEALKKCEAFFNKLQQKTAERLYPGQVKVQFVYDPGK